MPAVYGLSTQIVQAGVQPVVDVAAASISSSFSTPVSISAQPIAILYMQNSTNEMVDVALMTPASGSAPVTNFHILPGTTLVIESKTNYIVFSAQTSVSVKATSTLPTSGMVSFSAVVVTF